MAHRTADAEWPRSSSSIIAVRRIATALAFLTACGCGGQDAGVQLVESTAVEPGTMITVSITPLDLPAPRNLINNGDFAAWQTGASAPDFFMAPDGNAGHSTLEPAPGPSGNGTAVRQRWKSSDALAAFTDLFRTWVVGLRPDTRYRFSVSVDNPSQNVINLRAFEYPVRSAAEGEIALGRPNVLGGVVIEPTRGFEEYSFEFTTGASTELSVLIAPKTPSAGQVFPSECVWQYWRLVEVSGKPEPADP